LITIEPTVSSLEAKSEVVVTLSFQDVLYALRLAVTILDVNVYPASKPRIFSFLVSGLTAFVKFK